jgi:hypothetical protein
MGRIMVLEKLLVALPELAPGYCVVRERWRPVDEALARWEDDGGRVVDRAWTLSSGPLPGTAPNRAQLATAR